MTASKDCLFDGPPATFDKAGCRVGSEGNVVPVDRYFKDLWYPGLVAAILRGERPLPKVDITVELPPMVSILSPHDDGELDDDRVTIEAIIEDLGGGFQQPWVTVNNVRVEVDTEFIGKGSGVQRQSSSTVSERGLKRESPRQLRWKFNVKLEEGKNVIRVHSASREVENIATVESEPATVTMHSRKPTLPTELYLLAVGVSQYKNNMYFGDLSYAAADAKALADLFRSQGEVSYGVGHVHVRTLLNGEATKANIQQALQEIAEQAGPQDLLMLAMAGHGKRNDQKYYFISHEFEGDNSPNWSVAVQEHGLPIEQIGQWVRCVPARKRVMILDTCESGGAIGALYGVLTRGLDVFQLELGKLQRDSGLRIVAASSPAQVATENGILRHGYLTYALLAGLNAVDHGPLDGQFAKAENGIVRIDDWLEFAKEHVPELGQEKQLASVLSAGKGFPILTIQQQQ